MSIKEFIDTHAHLAFSELDTDLKSVIEHAKESGVKRIVNIASGSGLSKIRRCYEISSEYNNVYNATGIHPNEVNDFTNEDIEEVEKYIQKPKTVAVGEVGIDLYRSPSGIELQKDIFRRFARLSKKHNLPLVIHQREAFKETVELLKDENIDEKTGFVFHCFGGSPKEADKILDLGGHISVTGIITFKKAHYLRETVSRIPLERLMIETDAPFLAPEPKRGKRNEPSYVVYIAQRIAELKKIAVEEVALATTANAVRFFNLPNA